MAVYYGAGDSSTRVIGSKEARASSRSSVSLAGSSPVTLWTPMTYTKQSSTSELHVHAFIIGNGKNSYPYYGTYIRAEWSGGAYDMSVGSHYSIGAYVGSGSVIWHVNQIWTPSNLSNQTGNITFKCRFKASNNSNSRPFNTWNPNTSDESRAHQQGSVFVCQELEIA